MRSSGTADIPLHGGRVPTWLAERMTKLGTAISENIVLNYGTSELLSRLSDPFWFQALGCVMGMDWHSSGITTSVLGALKRGLNPKSRELGIYICGGRGRHSRNTPAELRAVSEFIGLDGDALVRTSRLTAKIDNNAIADGFQLYLHNFLVTASGEWVVVQQGMNDATGFARRYHWHSSSVRSFTSNPHAAIAGEHQGVIMNLVDEHALQAQDALLGLSREHPDRTMREIRHLELPAHHDVRSFNVDEKRLAAVLFTAYEKDLCDFASLLLLENLGPRTLQTLALVAEVIHGTPTRFSDPARFSFALGGKDRHPFPVPLRTYDETIAVLRRSVDSAKLGRTYKLDGLKRLDQFVRRVEETYQPEVDLTDVIAHEVSISPSLQGRSVFDDSRTERTLKHKQLRLF
jgi:hypothetical protein